MNQRDRYKLKRKSEDTKGRSSRNCSSSLQEILEERVNGVIGGLWIVVHFLHPILASTTVVHDYFRVTLAPRHALNLMLFPSVH